MSKKLVIRRMTRSEVNELVEWAACEGWNPGLHDADAFWETDPDAFIAATYHGNLIGGGAISAYEKTFGFMGFFIIRPEFRGKGHGNVLWHARRDRLRSRLETNACIGLDGVFEMQNYYAKGGFVFSHRNIRFHAEIPENYQSRPSNDTHIVPLSSVLLEEIEAYDRSCFPARRRTFLKTWITLPDSLALGYKYDEELKGYGIVRRCKNGCKLGPLFADNARIAELLFGRLALFAAGGPLYLDVPENNPDAMTFAQRHNMTSVFGCARMYLGSPPVVAHERIFGITTFELG